MEVAVDEMIDIQTQYGKAEAISFTGLDKDHIVFAFGSWRAQKDTSIRIHSECLTGDVFGSQRCDCGPQLGEAMKRFAHSGGLIVYLRQEGRGIGLLNKMRAYRLQDEGFDTYQANRMLGFENDQRDFKVAADMLKALNLTRVQLLSNNPSKAKGLEENGIKVVTRQFTQTYVGAHNRRYLDAKIRIGGHDGLKFSFLKEAKHDSA